MTLNMKYTLNEILQNINEDYHILGEIDDSIMVDNLKPTNTANKNSLVFITPNRADK